MPATQRQRRSTASVPAMRHRNRGCASGFGSTATEASMAAHKKATRKTARKSPRKSVRKSAARSTSTARRTRGARKTPSKRWSQRVTKESDALDLEHGVFKQASAKKIAASLKASAEHSTRRKSGAYRSALSMLTFYINRAGRTLPKAERSRLERAKVELKHQFGRD
ncbi:hypothetical protein ACVISU_003960 [Bradyrhizobium sp. USDA 4452]